MIEPPRSRLPQILAVSVGLHLVLGFALTRIPASRDLLRRVIPIKLVERKKVTPKPKAPPKPQPAKAKAASPRRHAAPPQAPTRPSLVSAGSGPSFGMDVGAAPGGTMEVPVGDTLAAPATASAAPPPLVLEVADEPGTRGLERVPTPVGTLRVVYPELARLAGQGGSAVVQAYVEADGRVARAELVSASGATFGRAALEALQQSRFAPAKRLGVAVACTIRIPVRFELNAVQVLPAEPLDDSPELPVASGSIAMPSLEATTSLEPTASIPGVTP